MNKIPVDWAKSIQKLPPNPKGIIFLLGAADTGKTTFCHVLVNFLVERGLKVAVIDADVGQSDIGPPTTIGFALFEDPPCELRRITPDGMYFVGNNSPSGHLLEVVVGTRRMIDKACQLGCDTVIVDSSGLVNYPYGIVLKYRKIELVRPDFIFAFERQNELKHIIQVISKLKKFKLIKTPVPHVVARVLPGERRLRRERSYASYFANATFKKLKLDSFSIFPSKNFLSKEVKGLIVGLKDAWDEVVGVGILSKIDFKKDIFEVFTPVSEMERIVSIVLGTLKLDSSYREVGRV